MRDHYDRVGGRRGGETLATVACAILLLVTGCAAAGPATNRQALEQQFRPDDARAHVVDRKAAAPVRIRIPAIDVVAPVDPLDVTDEGVLPAPRSNKRTGWWRAGPEPGERGPAVIAGHVDSYRGPAVFYRLDDLEPKDTVLVDRGDGSTAVFMVRRVERRPKDRFPTGEVYSDTPHSALRVITCGGRFDEQARTYLANVIVYAVRTG